MSADLTAPASAPSSTAAPARAAASRSDPATFATADGSPTAAPRRRGRWRSLLGWIGLAVAVVLVVLLLSRLSGGSPTARGALDPEAPTDAGALALAEILRDQGVELTVVDSRAEAMAAIDDDTTLAMASPFTLSDEAVTELIEPADHVVFLSSSARLLRLLDLGQSAPLSADPVTARCDLPELERVGTIRPDRVFLPEPDVTACFTDDEGAAAVLVRDDNRQRVALVEGAGLFSNAHLAEDGNAALALALLGQNERVVWYVPWYDDTDIEAQGPEVLADRTPEWLTPAILLLLLGGIVATIARGQRFGPLVAETLPVTVRASETMHGRARLTAKAADAAHAATALQTGTRRRLAARLGLAVHAQPAEVADAATDRLRIPRGSLYDLLGGPPPTTDADLIDFSRRLADLESAVDAAVTVERNTP